MRALVAARDSFDPSGLRRPDGSLDVALLSAPQGNLSAALRGLDAISHGFDELPTSTGIGPIDEARGDLEIRIADLRRVVTQAEAASRLGPAMLGAGGVRRYFVAMQNNAEARATGGLLGVFGILEARGGKLSLVKVGTNRDLRKFKEPVIRLDEEFELHYRGGLTATTLWANANLSPHFPYAARIWSAMWEKQFAEKLDGVIATDPVMLSHLLQATGPIPMPGGPIVTSENVVDLTERAAYETFEDDNAERKEFLKSVTTTVADAVLRGSRGTPKGIMTALRAAASDGRILVWSRYQAEADVLEDSAIGGTLSDTPGPFAGVYINNAGANKLDYYLDRVVEYRLGPCLRDGRQRSTVTITLTNQVPDEDLPGYVVNGTDGISDGGKNTIMVVLYTSYDAELVRVELDGTRTSALFHEERGRPAYTYTLTLPPREARTLTYTFVEPRSESRPLVPEQPLSRPQESRTKVTVCGAQ